jgi:ankyrin repeat protein
MGRYNANGQTPLAMAAVLGHIDVVKQLLEKGAALEITPYERKLPPLHLVALNGHTEVLRLLLLYGADVGLRNHMHHTCVHQGARRGHVQVVKLLLGVGADAQSKSHVSYVYRLLWRADGA